MNDKNWKKNYQSELCTAEEAVTLVHSGDWVLPAHAAGEPKRLVDALLARKKELKNVVIWGGVSLSNGPWTAPEYKGSFHMRSHFLAAGTREAYFEGRVDYLPLPFSSCPKALREGYVRCDVFLTQVSPPDENGYCSFGISVDMSRACMEAARVKIAQVNRQMPRTAGDTLVHISEFDRLVEIDDPIYTLSVASASGEETKQIGKHIASLIEDGDTIQMGIGSIPNAILDCLGDRRDLGVHTEVFTDNLIPLVEKGVITGAKKTLNRGKIVSTFIQGTEALYRYVDRNDMLLMKPVNYTNSIGIIGQHDNMVAVNAALEVDLMGQVVADSLGNRQFSGIGGQMDFIRGAMLSKHGRAIIALPSTAKRGTISRIVACLRPGTAVSTPRNEVHYVVTEHGAVNLYCKTLRERAGLLLSIAAPQFREQLEKDFWELMRISPAE